MTMRRLFDILIAAVGIAVLGFALHGCPMIAFALDGSGKVIVKNGDVSLYCANNNRLLGKETGDVDCLANLPEGITQQTVILSAQSFGGSTQYYAQAYTLGYVGDAIAGSKIIGCALDTYGIMEEGALVAVFGNTVCAKAAGTITGGARITHDEDNPGRVRQALDTEEALGLARNNASSVATTVDVFIGSNQAPKSFDHANTIHLALMSVRGTKASINSDSFAQIAPATVFNANFTDYEYSTLWVGGTIVSGLSCTCDDQPGSGKTVDFELCKNAEACTGGDLISNCSQITDSSSLTCTDDDFAETATLATDRLFIKQTRNSVHGSCEYPVCRFAYKQTEYE